MTATHKATGVKAGPKNNAGARNEEAGRGRQTVQPDTLLNQQATDRQTTDRQSAEDARRAEEAHNKKPVDTGVEMLRNSEDKEGKAASERVAKATQSIDEIVSEMEKAPQGEHDRIAALQLRNALRDALQRSERFVSV